MATTTGAKRVTCKACGWHGQRVPRDLQDPGEGAEIFGACPSCSGRLSRQTINVDKKAARAKAELQQLATRTR